MASHAINTSLPRAHDDVGLAPEEHSMPWNLHGRVVVVTGASAGVGRAIALAFAAEGARVALIARGGDRLQSASDDVVDCGGEAMAIEADVARYDDVERAASAVEERWGPIDVWVNNAMVTVFSPVAKIAPEDLQRVTDVTYHGTVWGTMAALKRMRPRDRGTIIQVGSALAYRSIPLQAAYCGAKSAARGFTDSLRCELIHDRSRIKLVNVHIAAFNTPQFDWAKVNIGNNVQPLPPIFEPEVAGDAIVYAAKHPRRELWVGMPTVQTIWGQRLAAPLLDYYLAHAAWSGQQDDEPLPDRDSNLHSPPPGDPGVRGRFSDQAKDHSLQLWLTKHRALTGAFALGAASSLLGSAWRALRRPAPPPSWADRARASVGWERHRR
jgi:NAD(P)-dependent dehydrogenase (short-subunit alcohol dehydrogenase family)